MEGLQPSKWVGLWTMCGVTLRSVENTATIITSRIKALAPGARLRKLVSSTSPIRLVVVVLWYSPETSINLECDSGGQVTGRHYAAHWVITPPAG